MKDELSREQKMGVFLVALRNAQYKEVSNEITITSMHTINGEKPSNMAEDEQDEQDSSLCLHIPPYQQTQLLEILKDKYKCLTFEEKPYFKTKEDAIKATVDSGKVVKYASEEEFMEMVNDLSEQKVYTIKFNDNFVDVFEKLIHESSTIFRLHLEELEGDIPVLFVNETPIRKFQNGKYNHKMMKIALGLTSGSLVYVKDLLKNERRYRGCSQDLNDIFRESALRVVFTRDIKNDSFRIFHQITEKDLQDNEAFQKLVKDENAFSDTVFLKEKIKKSKISL